MTRPVSYRRFFARTIAKGKPALILFEWGSFVRVRYDDMRRETVFAWQCETPPEEFAPRAAQ